MNHALALHSRLSAAESLFARLADYQDSIVALLDRAEAMARSGPLDAATVGHVRWELARLLREYQLFKHSRLFDPLIAQGGPRAVLATTMKASCERIGAGFRVYVLEWNGAAVGDQPIAHKLAARAQVSRLRAHLRRERNGARALLQLSR